MWEVVRRLRDSGVTIILTTHYIEEAEEMADRVGVINKGRLVLVEEKAALMKKLGKKELALHLQTPLGRVPESLAGFSLQLSEDGSELTYVYDTHGERTGITRLFKALEAEDIRFSDLQTKQSSLEEIFVNLVSSKS
jgi:ABC-2 type transport system ATP-binding protein